jgi:hypothetical protein
MAQDGILHLQCQSRFEEGADHRALDFMRPNMIPSFADRRVNSQSLLSYRVFNNDKETRIEFVNDRCLSICTLAL